MIPKISWPVNPGDAGNVFYPTETVSIPVSASVGKRVSWTVTDYFATVVATGSTPVSAGATTNPGWPDGECPRHGYSDHADVGCDDARLANPHRGRTIRADNGSAIARRKLETVSDKC